MRFEVVLFEHCQMGDFLGWAKQFVNCSSHILCGISAFGKVTFSDQDAVRTPIFNFLKSHLNLSHTEDKQLSTDQ